jgi:hypothetical protein
MTETEFKNRLTALFDEAANDIELEQIDFLTMDALDAFFEAEDVANDNDGQKDYVFP